MSTKRKVSPRSSPCSSPRSKKCKSPVSTEPEATLPVAIIPEAIKVQLAQTKWGDPRYLAERNKIVEELDLLDINGKTGTDEYNRLIEALDVLDIDSMDDFIDNTMDIETANKVNKLNRDYEKIIYKLREAHDIKKELEANLQLGKEKRRKTINQMLLSLTNINTLIDNLEEEKKKK